MSWLAGLCVLSADKGWAGRLLGLTLVFTVTRWSVCLLCPIESRRHHHNHTTMIFSWGLISSSTVTPLIHKRNCNSLDPTTPPTYYKNQQNSFGGPFHLFPQRYNCYSESLSKLSIPFKPLRFCCIFHSKQPT